MKQIYQAPGSRTARLMVRKKSPHLQSQVSHMLRAMNLYMRSCTNGRATATTGTQQTVHEELNCIHLMQRQIW